MKLRKMTILPALVAASFFAASPALAAAPAAKSAVSAPARATRHASLRIDVGRSRAPWIGEAVPITVTAAFRDVDQVTLEGPLRVTSPHVITTSLPAEPKQWQERVGGVPTLMVRWTGTVTPAAAGPLDLSAELPVRVGFRDLVKMETRTRAPLPSDLFADDDVDPFGDPFASSMFRRMEEQMRKMQKDVFDAQTGSLREEATTLSATASPLEVHALPTAGRPATFGGAVGHFDVSASLASNDLHTSEPVTLRIVVEGEGDLDRVDLAGVPSSATWKSYPAHAVTDREPPRAGARSRKVFEQTLVPLTAGAITVPGVELEAFDPGKSAYVTRASAPIEVSVAKGPEPAAAIVAPAPVPAPPASVRAASHVPWILAPVALGVALVAVLIALGRRRFSVRRMEAKLRRRMRSAAADGALVPFAEAARDLIRGHLAKQWGMVAEAVTTRTIRERLGEAAKPLIEALALDSALRFGGGTAAGHDLPALAAEVEATLARAR